MGAILVLRALALAGHHHRVLVRKLIGQTHGAVGLVDVLAARTGRAVRVGTEIFVFDRDFDLVVDHGKDPDRGEAGLPPGVGIERRDADEAMDAAFRLKPAIGVVAEYADRRRFDAGALARAFLDPLDLAIMALGPAHIHAQQHFGPVLGVVAVGLAREQAFGLALAGFVTQLAETGLGLGDDVLVALGLAHIDQAERVVKLILDPAITLNAAFQPRFLAHDRLRALGIVPEIGGLGKRFQFVEAFDGFIPVKD